MKIFLRFQASKMNHQKCTCAASKLIEILCEQDSPDGAIKFAKTFRDMVSSTTSDGFDICNKCCKVVEDNGNYTGCTNCEKYYCCSCKPTYKCSTCSHWYCMKCLVDTNIHRSCNSDFE